MSTRRTTGSGKVNKVKVGILIGGVLVLFLAFATIWDQTHSKKPEPQAATQETVTSADESNSAGDSSTTDANASTEPVPDNISVNEMQAKIDELQQQIATKDEQIKQLEAGEAAENGGITFREFLTLYFRPDGNTYRLAEGRKIYSNSDCTQDYELDASNYNFSTTITLPFEGLNVQMLLTSDGQVVWSPDPYFERIDS